MRRLWLEWDGDKATGVWEGRIGDVELEEGFTEATLWGVNLKAGDETVRLIASEWDSDHGNHPQWIDCCQALGMDDFYDAVRHMTQPGAQGVAEPFRNEIREHGITRQIFPPEAVTTAAEEIARQMVAMVSSDDMLQGVRRMQEAAARIPEGNVRRVLDRAQDMYMNAPDDAVYPRMVWLGSSTTGGI